jgi:4-hydroxybenzoate polyprenyltransferase
MQQSTLRNWLTHLRLHYQLLLAPIFLWGYLLAVNRAPKAPDFNFWLAFLAFHVFLYGGTTAYNSYYDRDEGPVGGLAKPPLPVTTLLPFALVMQGIGALLAVLVNLPFLIIYLIIFVLGAAYSHPQTRFKGRPLAGLMTVGIGQGVLAALGGWVAAISAHTLSALSLVSLLDWLGIWAVALVTVGFYPITQIYQIEEDVARGDLTFAAWVGPQRTFRFAITVQAVAALLLVGVINQVLGPIQAIAVAIFYGALLAATIHWATRYDSADVLANFRRVMYINTFTSLGFLSFLVLHLFLLSPA